MVRRDRLHRGLLDRAADARPPLRGRRALRRRAHRPVDLPRLPIPPDVPAHVAGAAEPGALPAVPGAAPGSGAHRRRGSARPVRRLHGAGQLGDVAGLPQQHILRAGGPPVRPGPVLLRLRLPLLPAGPGLRHCRRAALAHRLAAHPLRLRRAAAADPWAEALGCRAGAAVGAAGPVPGTEVGRLLAGPLRHRLLRARRRLHRSELHGRQRTARAQDHPGLRRGGVRGGVLRQHLLPQLPAPGRRAGAAARHQRGHRGRVPGDRAAVRGPAQRRPAGGPLHREGHRLHSRRLWALRRRLRQLRPGGHRRRGGHGGGAGGTAQRHRDHPQRPPAGPQRPVAHVHRPPADPQRLRLPREAGHRPLHHRRGNP